MNVYIRPGDSWKSGAGRFVVIFGWAGDEPAMLVKDRGDTENRVYVLSLPDAWRWRTKTESSNGQDSREVVMAAAQAARILGCDTDHSSLKRASIDFIETVQHHVGELMAMPSFSMVSRLYLDSEPDNTDAVVDLIVRANGDEIMRRELTAHELDLFAKGVRV